MRAGHSEGSNATPHALGESSKEFFFGERRHTLATADSHARRRGPGLSILVWGLALACFVVPVAAQEEKQSDTQAPPISVAIEPKNVNSFGPTKPEDLPPVLSLLPENAVTSSLTRERIRVYGWVDGGYTYSSVGDGLFSIANGRAGTAPTPNRFGDEFILNGAWLIIDRVPSKEGWDWGFRGDFYAGSDAALLAPLNKFGPYTQHLGTDYRQAYFSFHAPVLSHGGVDVQIGRQNLPLGYETLMGPYRPLYSQTYYWIYFQVAGTGALATLHATNHLDLLGGVVLNYNTIFVLRGRAPAYIGKGTYNFGDRGKTSITAAVFTGPQPAPIVPAHLGSWQTVAESHITHNWSPRVTQVVLVNGSWDFADPAAHKRTSRTYGANSITTFHMNKLLDINTRGEWFRDERGVRTGRAGTFSEATAGVTIMPTRWIDIRPEIRGDFASVNAYGRVGGGSHKQNELTTAVDLILKF